MDDRSISHLDDWTLDELGNKDSRTMGRGEKKLHEYVAVKEDEYDDSTITREEACRAYQEIFQKMDEGWMVTRAE
ncbi:hypothetical protein Tco_0849589 [Tanacetum coccineum]